MQEVKNAKDLSGLLGRPGENCPQWLDPERFLAEHFKSELAVADLRRYVPLPSLQSELENYLASLKTKMVEVINADYSDYVSLSSRLVNVDGAVVRMRKPLTDLREKLLVIQSSVVGELTALNQGLKRRKEVATARSLLDLMQLLAHVASKVEKLLAEVEALPPMSLSLAEGEDMHADLDVRARLLERVAGEVSRLTFQANRGKDLSFVRSMEPRIATSRAQILKHLEPAMAGALSGSMRRANDNGSDAGSEGDAGSASGSQAAVLHCAHAYAELGETSPAEAALRTVVVAPIVAHRLSAHKAMGPSRGSAPATTGKGTLEHLFSSILDDVLTQIGPLLSASLSPQSPLRCFDFLSNSILVEVSESISTALPGAFSPGVPPTFQANYLAAQRFLGALESQCQSRTALDRLRASPHCASFLKLWNSSVYFSLIYQDIAGSLEDAIDVARPTLKVAPSGPASLCLPASIALVSCLERATAPNVYLPHLADKFLRLALQLGQRYKAWVASVVAARKDKNQPLAPHAPGTPSAAASHIHGTHASSPPGPKHGPGGPHQSLSPEKAESVSASSNVAWVVPLPIEEVMTVQQDMESAGTFFAGPFAEAFVRLISQSMGGEDGEQQQQGVRMAVQQLGKDIQEQAGELLGAACVEVVESCVNLVKQLKGITATYRMTSKGPPTRHSHYVTGVLGPLRAVLGSQASGLVAKRLATAVVDAVTVRYKEQAIDLLTTVRKTESSLKRLKKTRPGETEGSETGMSDSDKITLQLYLDVQEYGAQAAKFELQPQLLPSFQDLLEAVLPSPQVLTAAGLPVPASSAHKSVTTTEGHTPGPAAARATINPSGTAAPLSAVPTHPSPPLPQAPPQNMHPQAPHTAAPPTSVPSHPRHPQAPHTHIEPSSATHPFPHHPAPPPGLLAHTAASTAQPPYPLLASQPPHVPPVDLPAHSAASSTHLPYPFRASQPPHAHPVQPSSQSTYAHSTQDPVLPPYSAVSSALPPYPLPAPQPPLPGHDGFGVSELRTSDRGQQHQQEKLEHVRGAGGLRKQDAFACHTR